MVRVTSPAQDTGLFPCSRMISSLVNKHHWLCAGGQRVWGGQTVLHMHGTGLSNTFHLRSVGYQIKTHSSEEYLVVLCKVNIYGTIFKKKNETFYQNRIVLVHVGVGKFLRGQHGRGSCHCYAITALFYSMAEMLCPCHPVNF